MLFIKDKKRLDNASMIDIFRYLACDIPDGDKLNGYAFLKKNEKISLLKYKIYLLKYLIKRINKDTE